VYAYFGSLAKNITDIASGNVGPDSTTNIIIYSVSGVLIVVLVIFITYKAKKAINKSLNKQDVDNDTNAEQPLTKLKVVEPLTTVDNTEN